MAWAAGAIVVLAAVVISSWTFVMQPQQRRSRFLDVGAQPVGVAIATKGDIAVTRNALGAVTPLATITVHTQISGQLTEVGFHEGQRVRKGDFLAQIDPRPYDVALAQYAAQLARDDAALQEAKADLTRYQTLAQQESIARQTAEDQAWLVKQDEGTVRLDQAQIDAQKLNLTYCRIVAPVDGRVGLRLVDPGNYVQPSDATGIVVITHLDPISVVFSIPEDDLPLVLDKIRAGAHLEVTAFDRANVNKLAVGEFASIDNVVDTTTGIVRLRANFANKDEHLFPNQFVNVVLNVGAVHDALTIPAAAVQRGAPGTYVYLVKQDDTVEIRPVQLGVQEGERVAVNGGLAAGDRVVTDGADRLRDGAKVTVPGSAASTGPAAGAAKQGAGTDSKDEHKHRHHSQKSDDKSDSGSGSNP